MSLAVELHNAHKERLARIDRAVKHRELCAVVAKEAEKTDELEKYLAQSAAPVPEYKSIREWFSFDVEDSQPDQEHRYSVAEIQRAICGHFGITLTDMLSRRRDHKVMIPRQIAMYFCRHLTRRSLPEIGRMFGDKDHSTVHHAVRRTEQRIHHDPIIAHEVAMIEEVLV
jgi:chromosomal replication initiation ATPase DnaA